MTALQSSDWESLVWSPDCKSHFIISRRPKEAAPSASCSVGGRGNKEAEHIRERVSSVPRAVAQAFWSQCAASGPESIWEKEDCSERERDIERVIWSPGLPFGSWPWHRRARGLPPHVSGVWITPTCVYRHYRLKAPALWIMDQIVPRNSRIKHLFWKCRKSGKGAGMSLCSCCNVAVVQGGTGKSI